MYNVQNNRQDHHRQNSTGLFAESILQVARKRKNSFTKIVEKEDPGSFAIAAAMLGREKVIRWPEMHSRPATIIFSSASPLVGNMATCHTHHQAKNPANWRKGKIQAWSPSDGLLSVLTAPATDRDLSSARGPVDANMPSSLAPLLEVDAIGRLCAAFSMCQIWGRHELGACLWTI